jgi:hypothetical protein
MEALLTTVLGARRVYDSGDDTYSLSKERFFLVGHAYARWDWTYAKVGRELKARAARSISTTKITTSSNFTQALRRYSGR